VNRAKLRRLAVVRRRLDRKFPKWREDHPCHCCNESAVPGTIQVSVPMRGGRVECYVLCCRPEAVPADPPEPGLFGD
jgi:hypothetical protein